MSFKHNNSGVCEYFDEFRKGLCKNKQIWIPEKFDPFIGRFLGKFISCCNIIKR